MNKKKRDLIELLLCILAAAVCFTHLAAGKAGVDQTALAEQDNHVSAADITEETASVAETLENDILTSELEDEPEIEVQDVEEEAVDVEEEAEEEIPSWIPSLDIDHAWFSSYNEDYVGMIYIPALIVENESQVIVEGADGLLYPVAASSDNSDYLHTDFYSGEESDAGSIFLDYASNSDLDDLNTIIYGHNMGDLSYFGSLKLLLTDSSLLTSDGHVYLYMADGTIAAYEIFAAIVVPTKDEIYQQFYGADISDEVYDYYVDRILSENQLDWTADIDFEDRPEILSLSTCYQLGGIYKLLVFGARVY